MRGTAEAVGHDGLAPIGKTDVLAGGPEGLRRLAGRTHLLYGRRACALPLEVLTGGFGIELREAAEAC